jgi:type III secretion system (T3SS) SseB-like protein
VDAAERQHVRGAGDLPAIVFAPARPDIRPEHRDSMVFEVRRASDGGLALPVFSSLDRLTGALGPDQPWVALPLHNIQVIMGGSGVGRILVDPDAEPDAQRWDDSDLTELERRLG